MSLIFMLCLGAGGAGFWCAFTEGKHSGNHGLLIGLIVGLVAAFIGFFGMRLLLCKGVIQWMQRCRPKFQFIVGLLFCFLALFWAILSAFIGSWLTRWIIHLSQ